MRELKIRKKGIVICGVCLFFLSAPTEAPHWKRYCNNCFPRAWSTAIQPEKHPISLSARFRHCQGPQPLHRQCLLQVLVLPPWLGGHWLGHAEGHVQLYFLKGQWEVSYYLLSLNCACGWPDSHNDVTWRYWHSPDVLVRNMPFPFAPPP